MKIGTLHFFLVMSFLLLPITTPYGKSTTELILGDCNLSGAEVFVLEGTNSTYNISLNITNNGSEPLTNIVIHFIMDEYLDLCDLNTNNTLEPTKTMNIYMLWIIDNKIKPGQHNMTIQITDKHNIELYATFPVQFSVKYLSVAEFVVGYFTVDPYTFEDVPIGEKRTVYLNFSIHNIGDQYGEINISINDWDNNERVKVVLLNYSVRLDGHGEENISVKWNVSKNGTHTVIVSLAGMDGIVYGTKETHYKFWNKLIPEHDDQNNLFLVEFSYGFALILLIVVVVVILIFKFGPK